MSSILDVLIIGKGPAGLQAALYIARSGLSLAVVGNDAGSLALAGKVENYYGLPAPCTGPELQRNGEAQVCSFGAEIHDCQVLGFGFLDNGEYQVITTKGEFQAKALLIATGARRSKPPVEGIGLFEGKGVSYCAVCDGFLYRGKKTGVLGHAEYAFAEARELVAINGSTVLFTNGETPDFGAGAVDIDPDVLKIVSAPIKGLEWGEHLSGIRFKDGGFRELDGLFVAYGTASGSDLARKLGVLLSPKGDIFTDRNQETNIPGVYAAGDCTGVFRQVAVAAGQGALAAKNIIEYVRNH